MKKHILFKTNKLVSLVATILATSSAFSSATAAVDYVDYTAPFLLNPATWAVDPQYSSAPRNSGQEVVNYTIIAPRKNQGVPITSFGAKIGGGVDVFFTNGEFMVQGTSRTENYQAFAYNYQATGNQDAVWGSKVGGGLDYLYYENGDLLKYTPASNLTGSYRALAPANAGTQILSSYGARAGGGIDFLYYNATLDLAERVDTGLNSSIVYQALSLNTAAGNPNAFWGARVGGGVDYMYYDGAAWINLTLADNLATRNYLGFAGMDGSSLDVGTYATRADGGIDLISIQDAGNGVYNAVVNTTFLTGNTYNSLSLDRSGMVPGDFFANAVPEPSTYGMLAAAGALALLATRRRKQA